jgi:hypothetical protein
LRGFYCSIPVRGIVANHPQIIEQRRSRRIDQAMLSKLSDDPMIGAPRSNHALRQCELSDRLF